MHKGIFKMGFLLISIENDNDEDTFHFLSLWFSADY